VAVVPESVGALLIGVKAEYLMRYEDRTAVFDYPDPDFQLALQK
jgi:hypothetical protein